MKSERERFWNISEYESAFCQSDETEMNCREFDKVADGVPVTALRSNVSESFIANAHDYREHLHAKNEPENAEARRQAESGETESFCSIADLMADLDD